MPGAEEAFNKLLELESQKKLVLYILSSIDFEDGRKGKTEWIKEKTNFPLEKVIFCLEPEDQWADKDSWLIDDRKKFLEPFATADGNIIEFTGTWMPVIKQIDSLIRT